MIEDKKNPKNPKNPKIYSCIICMLNTSNKKDYDRHLLTQKHMKALKKTNEDDLRTNEDKKSPKTPDVKFGCECGKIYKYKRGLWNHQQKCNYGEPLCVEIKKSTEASGDVVALLMEQNKLLTDQSRQQAEQSNKQIELLTTTIKDMAGNIGSNNTTTNNQFNINMFLNEECKDAINMSDFIKSIEVSLDQLQYTTNNGLCKGVTRVIMDNMNKLSKYERPLHCSDLKRETIYIKDNDKWEKDTNKEKLKEVIKKTSNKNYSALSNWNKENPNFMQRDDQQNFYARSMSAMGKPIEGVEDKIIKSICKDYRAKE
ncbi:hypothetical protein PGAG_00427 [Phaeocystis globosa virus 12T]|uniref:Multiple copy protein PGV_MIGE n=1 Tax=Phaeocystis globosa virus PgV-16T TaxID=3071227 RepID=A0AC59EWI2_9VIRU|nr:multiple copy protein PGV_MIGE [Phaeocystis globosa virus]AET72881.1 hypothetical protein PGAG_00427 [Phaeocystis globosa virus 12T]AET73622.1 hypothetical protein PGBG_00406 [Phaeocystis globosa virus 14T]AGM15321.1 multiple copy protein PGV_MIGE [Phaeocystis globosa virus PgV-16T]UYE94051.1 multiple copy protein [Phaeocystis globosa virus]